MDFDARLDLTTAVRERDARRRRYEEVVGSGDEIDAYVELHAANVRLHALDRYLSWSEGSPLSAQPGPTDAELEPYGLCPACAEWFEVEAQGTDDRVQYELGAAPSARLAAELNRERALDGEPPICSRRSRTPCARSRCCSDSLAADTDRSWPRMLPSSTDTRSISV